MQWMVANFHMVLSVLFVITEAAAAVAQIAFPTNQGITGFLAAVIKVLQSFGVKAPMASGAIESQSPPAQKE